MKEKYIFCIFMYTWSTGAANVLINADLDTVKQQGAPHDPCGLTTHQARLG